MPSPNSLGLRPLPMSSAAFLLTFFRVASWSYEPNFWLNWRKIYYPSPDWSSAFYDRSTNVLFLAYTAHFRFARFKSVIQRQSPLVDSSLFLTCPLHMRYACVLCATYTFCEDPHRHRDDFHRRINIFLYFFCPFGVRYSYPLICHSTICIFLPSLPD